MKVTFMNPHDFTPLFLCDVLGLPIKSREILFSTFNKMEYSEVLRFFSNIPMIFRVEDFPSSLYYEIGKLVFTSKDNITVLTLSLGYLCSALDYSEISEARKFFDAVKESVEPIYWLFNFVRSMNKSRFQIQTHTKI